MEPSRIKQLAAKHHLETVAIRREIHAHPELAFEEVNTSGLIARQLELLKIPVTLGIAKTGIVGLIEGKNPGKKNRCPSCGYGCAAYIGSE